MATFLYIGSRPASLSAAASSQFGLSTYRFDEAAATAEHIDTIYYEEKFCAGKAYVDQERGRFYITNEVSQMPGAKLGGGCIYSYRVDPDTGRLSYLNQQPSYAAKPSYVMSDDEGKFLLATNHGDNNGITRTICDVFGNYHVTSMYDESNLLLYPLNDDGSIAAPCDVFVFSGSGPKFFQNGPHAHCVVKAPGKNLYVVCDKGGNMIYTFSVDAEKKKLRLANAPLSRLPGSAPRYCVFHPFKPFLYVNKESCQRISAFSYDETGCLEELQVLDDIIPDGFPVPKTDARFQADITIDPQGHCLYVLIREANIINVYDIDESSGELTHKQTLSCAGAPRMCAFSPSGRLLAVSYPNENQVILYTVSEEGLLEGVASSIDQISPATVDFYQS